MVFDMESRSIHMLVFDGVAIMVSQQLPGHLYKSPLAAGAGIEQAGPAAFCGRKGVN